MAAGKSVSDILAGAKETLGHANALSESTSKEVSKAAPQPTTPPKHEYSSAPYTMAKEANDLGKGLKATMEMRHKAQKAIE
jgi:hypothetical protein